MIVVFFENLGAGDIGTLGGGTLVGGWCRF